MKADDLTRDPSRNRMSIFTHCSRSKIKNQKKIKSISHKMLNP